MSCWVWCLSGGFQRRGGDELSAAMFVDAVELEQYLPGLQARRVVAALAARAAGRTVYLEDGHDR
jgi:hypothetical protein